MKCKTCGHDTWTLIGEHRCPPAWEVWDSQNVGDEPEWPKDFFWSDGLSSEVYAADPEAGVEIAHELADAAGDDLEEETFWIRRKGSEEPPDRWSSIREFYPTYSATRSEEP